MTAAASPRASARRAVAQAGSSPVRSRSTQTRFTPICLAGPMSW